jgi:hypothetical protein
VQQAVGKRRLPVINVGNDAEISYMRCVHREKIPELSGPLKILPKRVNERQNSPALLCPFAGAVVQGAPARKISTCNSTARIPMLRA